MVTTAATNETIWRRYRALRNGLFGWGGGGIVALLLAGRALDFDAWPAWLPVVAACVFLAFWSAATIHFYFQLMFFRCPRCAHFFQSRGDAQARHARSWLPRSACAKCGLRVGEQP